MAKKKNKGGKKSGDGKKSESKVAERQPDPRVAAAARAYTVGNYAAVRDIHADAEGLEADDAAAIEAFFQKTLTDKTPWLVAAAALIVTVVAGLVTLT